MSISGQGNGQSYRAPSAPEQPEKSSTPEQPEKSSTPEQPEKSSTPEQPRELYQSYKTLTGQAWKGRNVSYIFSGICFFSAFGVASIPFWVGFTSVHGWTTADIIACFSLAGGLILIGVINHLVSRKIDDRKFETQVGLYNKYVEGVINVNKSQQGVLASNREAPSADKDIESLADELRGLARRIDVFVSRYDEHRPVPEDFGDSYQANYADKAVALFERVVKADPTISMNTDSYHFKWVDTPEQASGVSRDLSDLAAQLDERALKGRQKLAKESQRRARRQGPQP
jgi:hypothetical protein